jgi:hypothetical protein
MSLLEELEVLEKLYSEMRIAAVRCHCGMNKLVIHFKKKEKLSEAAGPVSCRG